MKIDKSNYQKYRKERARREKEISDLCIKKRKLTKKLDELTQKLHDDYPETMGEDPGY